jgi:hypothetical protein
MLHGYMGEDNTKHLVFNKEDAVEGEWIESVQIDKDEVTYLVKVSINLAVTMENYDEDQSLDFEANDPRTIQDSEL